MSMDHRKSPAGNVATPSRSTMGDHGGHGEAVCWQRGMPLIELLHFALKVAACPEGPGLVHACEAWQNNPTANTLTSAQVRE